MGKHAERVIIIGAGLGGLLTGAYLAMHGREVLILEALDLIGGRFTHIDYQGFAVPTGAFHTLPGGSRGPIAACLERLGVPLELHEPEIRFTVVLNGATYPVDLHKNPARHSEISDAIGLYNKWRLFARVFVTPLAYALGRDITVAEVLRGMSPDDRALRLFDHLLGFSISIPSCEASAFGTAQALTMQGGDREGYLRGGNRALVTGVLNRALEHGAVLRTGTAVTRILLEGGRAVGVFTEAGERLRADLVISNAGAARTARLLGPDVPAEYTRKVGRMVPTYGIAHAIRCRRQPLGGDSIVLPLDLPHIAGIAPISNPCPELCPPGWSFLLAYQPLSLRDDADAQVAQGQEELRAFLGSDIDVFNSAVYRGAHPAATISPRVGQHGNARFPARVAGVRGLYQVGQDVAGHGIAAEVIGYSCQRLWKELERT